MRTPMPSPKGTNREGLYLQDGRMGLDAKQRRLARDDGGNVNVAEQIAQDLEGLKNKLPDALYLDVQSALTDYYTRAFEKSLDRVGEAVELQGMDGATPRLREKAAQLAAGLRRERERETAARLPGLGRIRVFPS